MKILVPCVVLLKCVLILSQRQDSTSTCHVYNNFVIKTFEDEFYHFNSRCGYTLAQFTNNHDNEKVIVKFANDVIYVTAGTKDYEIKRNANKPAFIRESETLTLPAQRYDIEVTQPGTYMTANFTILGLIVQWDLKESIIIAVDIDQNTNLSGICSNKWKMNVDRWSDSAGCMSSPIQSCSWSATGSSRRNCKKLLNKKEVGCVRQLSPTTISSFLNVCTVVQCNCKLPNKNDCICPILQAFWKTCSNKLDQPIEWRAPDLCPIQCPEGLTYKECGEPPKVCGEHHHSSEPKCVEGCVCPPNLPYWDIHKKRCVRVIDCPCYYEGNFYEPKQSIKLDCKICTCDHNNKWNCPDNICYFDKDIIPGD